MTANQVEDEDNSDTLLDTMLAAGESPSESPVDPLPWEDSQNDVQDGDQAGRDGADSAVPEDADDCMAMSAAWEECKSGKCLNLHYYSEFSPESVECLHKCTIAGNRDTECRD